LNQTIEITTRSLPIFNSVLNDIISFSVLLWFPVIKIAAYESEIRFNPNIPDLGDLAIPHAISCQFFIV
jgi:hypothetical protein